MAEPNPTYEPQQDEPHDNLTIEITTHTTNDVEHYVISIHNPTNRAISGRGLSLTNGVTTWRLPSIIIRPQGTVGSDTVLVRGKYDEDTRVVKRMTADFEIDSGDVVHLVDGSGEVVHCSECGEAGDCEVCRVIVILVDARVWYAPMGTPGRCYCCGNHVIGAFTIVIYPSTFDDRTEIRYYNNITLPFDTEFEITTINQFDVWGIRRSWVGWTVGRDWDNRWELLPNTQLDVHRFASPLIIDPEFVFTATIRFPTASG